MLSFKCLKCKLVKCVVVGAVFLDLKKAFDSFNIEIILFKLSKLNTLIKTVVQTKSYSHSCSQRFHLGLSEPKNNIGVPQGSIVGPLLFSVYINDVPLAFPEVQTHMYGDDALLYIHAQRKWEVVEKLTGMSGIFE